MIYTITFNPAIDYILKVTDLKLGEVNRVEADTKYPGGKGINVSRVLNTFDVKSKALGFIGGFTGEYIKNFLENEGVETDFIKVKGDTRINIKLKAEEETEINGAGSQIDTVDLEKLFKQIENLNSEDFIVLAGNVQSSVPRNIYSQIQLRCSNKDVKFIVDTTGEALGSTLVNKPFLIKPNVKELGELFGVEIKDTEEIIHYGRKLLEMGAENVVVSMAAQGALLICKDGVYHASAPKGTVKNSVGAGDSLIGGFLAHYSQKQDILEAFRWGAATGSATAFSLDLCKREDVDALIEEVKITKVK
jgi:1-phosphofructokinase